MNISQVYAVYFSATGNTRKVTTTLANALAVSFDVPLEVRDFTLPAAREEAYEFAAGDLVVFGMPTYAGKLPNKLLDFVKSGIHGNGALAVPVVTFGNRSFDNSLAELCACLEGDGFHTIGAGAFACRHAFTDALAEGRPDSDDMAELAKLGSAVVGRIVRMTEYPAPVTVDGNADAPYYRPLGLDGEPKVFLKAKPKTDLDKYITAVCAPHSARWARSIPMMSPRSWACASNATPACATARWVRSISTIPRSSRTARCSNATTRAERRTRSSRRKKVHKKALFGNPKRSFFHS